MRVCSCTVLSERYKLTGSWGIAQGEESLIFLTTALDLRSVRCLDCASALVRLPRVPSVLLKRRPRVEKACQLLGDGLMDAILPSKGTLL